MTMQYSYTVPLVPDEFEIILKMEHNNPDRYRVFFHDIEYDEMEEKTSINASQVKAYVTTAFKIWNRDHPVKEVIPP